MNNEPTINNETTATDNENLYYICVNKEDAARILISVCNRDKVYTAESRRMIAHDRSYNKGVVGYTTTDRMIGVFVANSDEYMFIVINEAMFQSTSFFREVMGPIEKSNFKEFDWFDWTENACIIDNGDWSSDDDSSYDQVCDFLDLEPIDAEKEIDELIGNLPTLPIVTFNGRRVRKFSDDRLRGIIHNVPSIPAAPEWKIGRAIELVEREWVRDAQFEIMWKAQTVFVPKTPRRRKPGQRPK